MSFLPGSVIDRRFVMRHPVLFNGSSSDAPPRGKCVAAPVNLCIHRPGPYFAG
jgi:hypothetical protein